MSTSSGDYSEPATGPSAPTTESVSQHQHRVFDRTLGIMIGIILGLAVVAGFVFLGSEGTIDAPRISGVKTGKPAPQPQRGKPQQGSGQGGK